MMNKEQKKILVSHPNGNRNVRAIISALEQAGRLAEFHTSIAVDSGAPWLNFLPSFLRTELLRRTFPIPYHQIITHPLKELVRTFAPKIGLKTLVKEGTGWASIDSVYTDLDLAVSERLPELVKNQELKAVYAYEDGAFSTFTKAKELGIKCIYDLPIAYWEVGRKLTEEESIRLPEWAITLGRGLSDSQEKLDRKTRELEMADVVVGPGQFVMDSIPGWARNKKIIMAPFGSPASIGRNLNQDYIKANKVAPLRVLFVGSMSQRKGLGDLFEAIKLLNNPAIELVVMGSLWAPLSFYKKQLSNFTYEPGRAHDQVLALMRTCDVFCLPSIIEGRALVMQEAMSQQLPLIITPNTGGSDLIKEGKTGFLVPIRSPESIAEKINWFLENRERLPEMGRMAQEHAAGYTWEAYGNRVLECLD
jgi:glycosyltransferase involved in cell wall biosynthesis